MQFSWIFRYIYQRSQCYLIFLSRSRDIRDVTISQHACVWAIVEHRTLRVKVCCWGQFIVRKSSVLQIQTIRLTRDHVLFIFACVLISTLWFVSRTRTKIVSVLSIFFFFPLFFTYRIIIINISYFLICNRFERFFLRKKKIIHCYSCFLLPPLPPLALRIWEWEININKLFEVDDTMIITWHVHIYLFQIKYYLSLILYN